MIASIFSRSYTPDEVALASLMAVVKSSESFDRADEPVHSIAATAGVPIDKLTKEIMVVRFLAVDFALTLYLPEPPREAVRDAFLKWFRQWSEDGPQYGNREAPEFFYRYGVRAQAYGPAINAMKREDPPGSSFGDVFAAFCGADDHPEIAMLGFLEFSSMQRVIGETVKGWKIRA